MGAWIETAWLVFKIVVSEVAPHVGAWIETIVLLYNLVEIGVAPHVGAWIETCSSPSPTLYNRSLPMWERGLKQQAISLISLPDCRSPCGSVD